MFIFIQLEPWEIQLYLESVIMEIGSNLVIFYWLMSLDVAYDSKVYVTTDHTLSSYSHHSTNGNLYYFENQWNTLDIPFNLPFIPLLFLDKRDYIWVQGSDQGDYSSFFVFDGNEWRRSEEGQFPEINFKNAKVDRDNNIWLGTEKWDLYFISVNGHEN